MWLELLLLALSSPMSYPVRSAVTPWVNENEAPTGGCNSACNSACNSISCNKGFVVGITSEGPAQLRFRVCLPSPATARGRPQGTRSYEGP